MDKHSSLFCRNVSERVLTLFKTLKLGVSVKKTFLTDAAAKYARVFVPGNCLQASPIFRTFCEINGLPQ
jgi:hypothetical protein